MDGTGGTEEASGLGFTLRRGGTPPDAREQQGGSSGGDSGGVPEDILEREVCLKIGESIFGTLLEGALNPP